MDIVRGGVQSMSETTVGGARSCSCCCNPAGGPGGRSPVVTRCEGEIDAQEPTAANQRRERAWRSRVRQRRRLFF